MLHAQHLVQILIILPYGSCSTTACVSLMSDERSSCSTCAHNPTRFFAEERVNVFFSGRVKRYHEVAISRLFSVVRSKLRKVNGKRYVDLWLRFKLHTDTCILEIQLHLDVRKIHTRTASCVRNLVVLLFSEARRRGTLRFVVTIEKAAYHLSHYVRDLDCLFSGRIEF